LRQRTSARRASAADIVEGPLPAANVRSRELDAPPVPGVKLSRLSGEDIISFTESINQGFSLEFPGEQKRNSVKKLLVAAIESFAAKGYHGTTTRDIARSAEMSPAALYVHFASKRDLLYKLTMVMATAMLEDLRRAQAREGDPPRQLHALVSSYARCNARMHTAVHVATFEFDVLSPEQRVSIVALRHQVNEVFVSCLLSGRAAGQFTFENVQLIRLTIMSLCISVATWFSASGPMSPEQLGDHYGDLILRMVVPGGTNAR
jgi:AcrR family transcriptional regulator